MTPVTPHQSLQLAASCLTNNSASVQATASARTIEYADEQNILAACQSGDLQWLEEQLRGDASLAIQSYISGKKQAPITPFYVACQEGHDDIVRLLLAQRADVNCALSDGTTPLSAACSMGNDSIVELLLQQPDIDVNTLFSKGFTALHSAVWGGHGCIVELLLNRKDIDVNRGAEYCVYPLHVAAHYGHDDVAALLLKHPEVDVNARSDLGQTALHEAAKVGCLAIVNQLLEMPVIDIKARDRYGHMAIDLATRNGHHEVVVRLARVMEGFVKESDAQIAFGCAFTGQNLPWLRELLEKNPELASQMFPFYESGRLAYPLHLATERNMREVAALLLERGADCNAAREDGVTALVLSSDKGFSEFTALLLSQRTIKVNAAHKSGATPLYVAAQNGHVTVVKQLLDNGADPKLKSKINWRTRLSPLDIARKNNHQQVVKLLQAVEQKPAKVTEATPLLNPLSED